MDGPFIYSKYVTGKSNIGRGADTGIFCNLLAQGENIVIYEPPRTGKMSLVRQAFMNMKASGTEFIPVTFSLLNTRNAADLALGLGSAILRGCCNTPDEYADAVEKLLPDTHFVFDRSKFASDGSILSLNWDPDDNDFRAVFSLPYSAALHKGTRIYVLLEEFQNIMLTGDGDRLCGILQNIFQNTDRAAGTAASYIFCGSQVNAMHDIFGVRKLFYRQVERVSLRQIETTEIIEHVTRGFSASGKVIDRDLLLGVCRLFRNNICYINHFAAICDSLTRGYIMEPTLNSALDIIISIHEPRFISIMNDLTTFQVNLLKAILHGHTKFTSSEVIEEYGLNSSANVRRLKDALCKKEIASFDENGNPTIIDPLFEYWAKTRYYGMKI